MAATTTTKGRKSEKKPGAARASAGSKVGPGVAKAAPPAVVVDVTQPNARDALKALYPRALNDLYVDATPEVEAAAKRFLKAQAHAKAAAAAMIVAGNELCAVIGPNLGVRGESFRASWSNRDGQVAWKGIAQELGATAEHEAKHRGSPYRQLDVDPIVKG